MVQAKSLPEFEICYCNIEADDIKDCEVLVLCFLSLISA